MENTIIYIDITSIGPNLRNPRKTFDEGALGELADSIKQVGVLQPITVRPDSEAFDVEYQIVCGERRWRAAIKAGLSEIPAIIRNLSDDEAMDIAITENLQRKDVEPLEEAEAFDYLLKKGQTIQDLMVRFGKSESFIRTRLKLINLIDEFKQHLVTGAISIGQAGELCKYSQDIQTTVFTQHMAEGVWSCNTWMDKRPKELAERIDREFTNDLTNYHFDKTECGTCPNNSDNYNLFKSDKPRCADRSCQKRKEVEGDVSLALKLQKQHPEADFYSMRTDDATAAELVKQGHEVKLYRAIADKVGTVVSNDLKKRIEDGAAKLIVFVWGKPYLGCISVGGNGENGSEGAADTIAELKKKIERFGELKIEKQSKDASRVLTYSTIPTDIEQTPLEDQMMMFLMLQNFDNVIFDGKSARDEERWGRCAQLTSTDRAYIIRKWVFSHLQMADHYHMGLFIQLAEQYYPEEINEIKIKYQEEYLRRKEKADARIAEIESAKEEK